MEDSSEEILQVFVSFQRRGVEISMLDFSTKFESLTTFQFELLSKWFLPLTFELKGIFVHKKKKE